MSNSLVDARLNAMLDNLSAALDEVSLHDGFPGTTGANEISGGGYSRQSITWNAAATGALNSSNAPAFSVASATTVRWIGYYDTGASPDAFAGYAPNKQAADVGPFHYNIDVSGNIVGANAHGLIDDDKIVFFGSSNVPGGLTEGTVYFVITAATDTFQVSATQGGGAITLTDQGDQDVRCSQIVEEVFSGAGTFTLNDADFDFLT